MEPISAPVLIAPMQDVLVSEGHPAQFRCSISGEGSAAAPSPGLQYDCLVTVTILLCLCRYAGFLVLRWQRAQSVGHLKDVPLW